MEYVGICDTGIAREKNEDAILMLSQGNTGLFVVADGMGGHLYGEKASGHICLRLEQWWQDFYEDKYHADFSRMIDSLRQSLELANKEIYETYNQTAVCGSTVAILFVYQGRYGVIHAGDSRVYLYKFHSLKLMTMDDVWENQAVMRLAEKRMQKSNKQGKLTNAVGIAGELRCKIQTGMVKRGEVFILCTDGLYKYCKEPIIKKYMRRSIGEGKLQRICEAFLEIVYQNGAGDNISVVLVKNP